MARFASDIRFHGGSSLAGPHFAPRVIAPEPETDLIPMNAQPQLRIFSDAGPFSADDHGPETPCLTALPEADSKLAFPAVRGVPPVRGMVGGRAMFGQRSLQTRGVILDAGDVLYDARAWRAWLWQHLQNYRVHVSYSALFERWDRNYLRAVHRGVGSYRGAFRAFLLDLGLSDADVQDVEASSLAAKERIERETHPFPGVARALHALRSQGMRLAVLTDSESPSAAITRRFAKWGIAQFFSAVVSSADLRATKPAPSTYKAALAALKLLPHEAVFVGHDEDELVGARCVGLATVGIGAEARAAVVRVATFAEILQVLGPLPDGGDRGFAA